MQERRQHIRISSPVMIEFPNPDTMKTERSFSRDASETGLRFPTTVRLQISQELPLSMRLPFSDVKLHATGEIVWIRQIARHGIPQYEIGVHFRWIEDPDRQRLMRHLSGLFPH